MVVDLLATSIIEEHDLVAANVLYKSLCKKMGGDACQCGTFPLLDCSALNRA